MLTEESSTQPTPNAPFRIAAFPQGSALWRIDWFGDITFPDRTIRRKQPSVFLHLSRVNEDHLRSDDPATLLSPSFTIPARFQKRIWVSVGTLPVLRIGDLWTNGTLAEKPDYLLEYFRDVQIDSASTMLIKAGLNQDGQGFLLPLSEHPWHVQCTHSYCVMVNLPENRRLIIPCMELIRFYFGSSSNLVAKLFTPPLTRESLYTEASLDRRGGRLQITLADKISGASAADIGRLHLDPAAWRAAVHIGTSILKASLAGQPIHPQAFFPFEGKTTLTAAGKWLSFAGQERATFLVYSLRSCSHPFPFKSLRYEAKGNNPRPVFDKDKSTGEPRTHKSSSAKDSPDHSLVERDASNRLASRAHPIRREPRFPDLVHKPIYKSAQLFGTSEAGQLFGAVPAIQDASVGAPGSENRVRSKDFALIENEGADEQRIPIFLQTTVAELRQLQGVAIDLLTHSGADGWTVPVSIHSDEDGEIDPRLFLAAEDGYLRLRRASIFALHDGKNLNAMVVIETEPLHKVAYPIPEQATDYVSQLLLRATEEFLKYA